MVACDIVSCEPYHINTSGMRQIQKKLNFV